MSVFRRQGLSSRQRLENMAVRDLTALSLISITGTDTDTLIARIGIKVYRAGRI